MQISNVLRNAFRRPSEYLHDHPTFFRIAQIACAALGCGGILASRSSRFCEDDPKLLVTLGTLGTLSGALIPFLIRAAGPAPDSEEPPSSTAAEPASERSSPVESLTSSDFEHLHPSSPIVVPAPPIVQIQNSPARRFFFVSGFPFVRYGKPQRKHPD